MGQTIRARLRFEGETYDGEAMLEATEILFRGERRLAIPLAQIRSIQAARGTLSIEFGDSEAALELGAEAAKWLDRIKNPKSVLQKLGIKPGQCVALVQLEEPGFREQLDAMGVEVVQGKPRKACDAIFLGASSRADLQLLESLKARLVPNGALWVIRPRGVPEITEGDVMSAGQAVGLVDVKVVRFSESRTAEKFVIPLAARKPRKP
jgi:hypothetical protein